MRAEIISVGTELLLGQIVDTNATFLAQVLAELGIDLYFKTTVGDNWARIQQVTKEALSRSDLLLFTGGLGPTEDDLTKEAVADLLGLELVREESVEAHIRALFEQRRRPLVESVLKQALIPRGAKIIPNRWGTAPGLIIEHGEKILILLPGVPREMKGMVREGVIPYLHSRGFTGKEVIRSRILRIAGAGEALVEAKLAGLLSRANPTIAFLAHRGEVHVRITAKGNPEEVAAMLEAAEQEVRGRLGELVFGIDEESLEEVVGRLLRGRRLTLGVVESCTGGLLSHRLTNVPGSSEYLLGAAVPYTKRAKIQLGRLKEALLREAGEVSPEVSVAMAREARALLGSDLGLSVTGVAGPQRVGELPVGTVYIALAAPEGEEVEEHRFGEEPGREGIKWLASQAALNLLRLYLLRGLNGRRS
ncbi:MAG: competence/damage-inducible protein A [Armatimonadota bacterium]|nr:competence/damage-inducible protein A [Armatimonadota bacterium]MDR5702450.1 competence/damage-inducible protein A [Armatimonadota bacterium]